MGKKVRDGATVFALANGGRDIRLPIQSKPDDIMRSILFSQPPITKLRLLDGIGWAGAVVNPAGVKLWEVMVAVK